MKPCYEITLSQRPEGWDWSVMRRNSDGTLTAWGESFRPETTAIAALREAEAEIARPGRALRASRILAAAQAAHASRGVR